MKVLQPLEGDAQPKPSAIDYGAAQPGPMPPNPLMGPPMPPAEPVTHKADPAILELANNDDLDVATIARQANKEIRKSPDEVEIRLH